MSNEIKDKYLGCFLGGAIGDALGAAVEFDSTEEIIAKYGPRGILNYQEAFGRIGAITDDTQMSLFTAEGLLLSGSDEPIPSVFLAYRRWLVTQDGYGIHKVEDGGFLSKIPSMRSRRAPGSSCLLALKSDTPFALGSNKRHNNSKGCGAVMRMAPVGLYCASPRFSSLDHPKIIDISKKCGYLTHGHPDGYLSGAYLALLIALLVRGTSLNDALDQATNLIKQEPNSGEVLSAIDRARRLGTEYRYYPPHIDQIGTGWVGEEALAIGIYCALVADGDFSQGVRYAVNHGGDSDSTGAIAGNILGALLGKHLIPEFWFTDLELFEIIEKYAIALFNGALPQDPATKPPIPPPKVIRKEPRWLYWKTCPFCGSSIVKGMCINENECRPWRETR